MAIKNIVCLLLLKCWSFIFPSPHSSRKSRLLHRSEKDYFDVSFVDWSIRYDFMTFSFRNREFEVAGLGQLNHLLPGHSTNTSDTLFQRAYTLKAEPAESTQSSLQAAPECIEKCQLLCSILSFCFCQISQDNILQLSCKVVILYSEEFLLLCHYYPLTHHRRDQKLLGFHLHHFSVYLSYIQRQNPCFVTSFYLSPTI